MMRLLPYLVATCLVALSSPAAFAADGDEQSCGDGVCTVRLTADQVLAKADLLVSQHAFAEAAPLIAALENAPQYTMERRFLAGYSAIETGDIDTAITQFRAILDNHPEQTRVRLELARALMIKGKTGGADYHYRLAQEDKSLPADVVATIRTARGILRDQRQWHFNFDVGIAPDSNVTNGTNAESIDVAFGNQTVTLRLDDTARAKSGIGQTVGGSGSVRLKLSNKTAFLIDGDGQFVNYKGTAFDDIATQLAAGPEFRLSDTTTLAVQAVAAQRWFGGRSTNTSGGIKSALQHTISNRDRVGISVDARRIESGVSGIYSGWQIGTYATYERVIARSMIASASIFGRRDALNSSAYAGYEFGTNIGIGGELPLGVTAGVSGGISRARNDGPLALFQSQPARSDWRYNARVNVGLRSIRVLGFSPSVTYTYAENASSLSLYDSHRHRFRFALARYF
jgi:outer membrane protein